MLSSKNNKEIYVTSLVCSMIFTLDFIYLMPQKFLIQENIFVFTMTFVAKTFLFMPLTFFMFTTIIYQKRIHIWLQYNVHSLIATPAVSYFILPTTDFLNYHIILTQ